MKFCIMKPIHLLLFVFFLSTKTHSQELPVLKEDYNFIGKIIGTVEKETFSCGYYAVAIRVTFENTSNSTKPLKTFSVIIDCPEQYGENFLKTGELYDISLSKNFPYDYMPYLIIFPFRIEGLIYPLDYWLLDIKK